MKHVNVNVDQIQVFVTISNAGMNVIVDANVKNLLIKVYVIKNLFRILVIANVNVINRAKLVSILIIQIVNIGKD